MIEVRGERTGTGAAGDGDNGGRAVEAASLMVNVIEV
jgi:hypothetical protein